MIKEYINKRDNKKYYMIKVYLGKDENGKRKETTRRGFKTRKEAVLCEAKIKNHSYTDKLFSSIGLPNELQIMQLKTKNN